jgi:hypothetical protein
MLNLVSIVEGYGEIESLPILMRRVLAELNLEYSFNIIRPIRQPRDKLLKADELERVVEFAARKVERKGGILVVLDSDGTPPCELGPTLLLRAARVAPDVPMRVVLAHKEWECWYLAAISSLSGHRGLRANLIAPHDPESIRGAKEWLSHHMEKGRAYSETVDQPKFAARFDLDAAKALPSFSKFFRDVRGLSEQVARQFPPQAA